MINVYGVYFICCINNYLDIVKEQLTILKMGLLQRTKKLIIFITKYNNTFHELNKLLDFYNENNKFIIITSPDNLYEKFAINNYKKYIKDKNYYLYYFHTKGLKKKKDPLFNVFSSRRKILNYYTLFKYKINIELLKKFDAVGCSLHLYPKKHFSGNFWWSKYNYLKKLKNINNGYLSPEMYILSNNNCNYISLANDTNDILFKNYKFPNNNDIMKKLTKKMKIIEKHKKLIKLCI